MKTHCGKRLCPAWCAVAAHAWQPHHARTKLHPLPSGPPAPSSCRTLTMEAKTPGVVRGRGFIPPNATLRVHLLAPLVDFHALIAAGVPRSI